MRLAPDDSADDNSQPNTRCPRCSLPLDTPRMYGTRSAETFLGRRPWFLSHSITLAMAIRSTSLVESKLPHTRRRATELEFLVAAKAFGAVGADHCHDCPLVHFVFRRPVSARESMVGRDRASTHG